jgi:hypothetical protein
MKNDRHCIALVVDADFGERAIRLSQGVHVWLIESRFNNLAAQRAWAEAADAKVSLRCGITTFPRMPSQSLEDSVVSIFETIDEHHDSYDEDTRWGTIEVYGIEPTARIKDELREYGVTDIQEFEGGFRATREEKAL